MAVKGLEGIDQTIEKTHVWLNEIATAMGNVSEHRAYLVLRAFLHAIRDHLTVDESAQFAAQLPMLVRGVYFEGWDPSRTPERERDPQIFLARIAREAWLSDDPDPERAVRAAAAVLRRHITEGEYADVTGMLPGAVRELLGAA